MMAICHLIALVDDDESVRDSLPPFLRSFGFNVRPFGSAADFLASECINQVGCLILDVAMPDMSGPELQQELIRRGIVVPVVFITAHSIESVRTEIMRSGAVACLAKPFDETAIVQAVRTALTAG